MKKICLALALVLLTMTASYAGQVGMPATIPIPSLTMRDNYQGNNLLLTHTTGTVNKFYSVGPTGSGADITWVKLDNIPKGSVIIAYMESYCLHANATSSATYTTASFWSLDGMRYAGEASIYCNVAGEEDELGATYFIQLDQNNKFSVGWWIQRSGGTPNSTHYLYANIIGYFK